MKWIKCSEKMPTDGQRIIAYGTKEYHGRPTINSCQFRMINENERWIIDERHEVALINNVTHWMPLPERPDEESWIKYDKNR